MDDRPLDSFTFGEHFDAVRKFLADEPHHDHALAIHDNIACCSLDEGIEHPIANKIASRVMKLLFNVDTRR